MRCPRCKADEEKLVDTTRNGNHSAFNGGRFQRSRYSALLCLGCGSIWRSKAAGCWRLRDAKAGDWEAASEARRRL